MQLKEGTLLQNGKYRIEKVLGQGGFGITYLAVQVKLHRKVAIKEFFMKEYCERDADTSAVSLGTSGSKELVEKFREKFVKEAQNIASFNHNNIIRIHDVFEENNTAYYVMEYLDCGSLSEYLSKRGRLTEEEAMVFIRQIADALSYIHKRKVNHLDVKPGNILLDQTHNAILIDFGLSKHYDEKGSQTSNTPVGISKGYAPLEQYKQGGVSQFSPESDIYSLGATFYKLVTGDTPPEAGDVNENGLIFPSDVKLSDRVKKAILFAMQPKRKDRPQSIDEFLKLLGGDAKKEKKERFWKKWQCRKKNIVEEQSDIIVTVDEDDPKPRKKPIPILIVFLSIILGVGGYFVYDNIQEKKSEEARIVAEKKEQAEAQKQAVYQQMQADKKEYIGLISEGDNLLNDRKYSESVLKYEQAKTYEDRYSDTEYSGEFNKNASQKIELANEAEQEYKAEQERLEKERQEREAATKAEQAKYNGHDWVDLGLPSGLKWATCNVGASSPEEYGNYYAWGETEPAPGNNYSGANCEAYGLSISELQSQGIIDGDHNLTTSHDAARDNWGGTWRLPTKAEMKELENRCIWKWTTQNGVNGYKVTGPNGNSIFLPAAGYRRGSSLDYAGEYGYYWSSTPDESGSFNAYSLGFNSSIQSVNWSYRIYGRSVRPVAE